MKDDHKLDNPVWYALNETHQHFVIEYNDVKFYHPDYCPFGSFSGNVDTKDAMHAYAALCNNFYIVGCKPAFNPGIRLHKELVCDQMLLENPIIISIDESIVALQPIHHPDLFALVNLVQPGYFKKKTAQMGNYFGIYINGELVAAAGQRMQMDAYTEVSAVVTLPGHTGKGYASQLIAHITNKIFSENKLPYLHVAATNTAAIKLYEKLGFISRRKISFWNLLSE